MTFRLLALLLGVASLPTVAQNAGANNGAGRGGGISFVTRRLPTSGVGGQAGNFFAAGGVPAGTVATGAGSAVTAAPPLAVSPASEPAVTDAAALAALRQLAAQGNQDAQRLLRESGKPVPAGRR